MQSKKFSNQVNATLKAAKKVAITFNNPYLEPEHLAKVIISSGELKSLLEKKKIEHNALLKRIDELILKLPKTSRFIGFSTTYIRVLNAGMAHVESKQASELSVIGLFLALVEQHKYLGDLGALLNALFLEQNNILLKNELQVAPPEEIAKFFTNLSTNYLHQNLKPFVAREKEFASIVQTLARMEKNNPLLIGEHGIGKHTLVLSIVRACLLDKGAVFGKKEVLKLDTAKILAGTSLRGQLEERMEQIISFLKKYSDRFWLYLQDIDSLFIGEESKGGIINLLKPSLMNSEINVIASCGSEVFKKYIETDTAFLGIFEPHHIEEPSLIDCEKIGFSHKEFLEAFHGILIDDDAIKNAIVLAKKHIQGKVHPSLAIEILDEAAAKKRISLESTPSILKKLDIDIVGKKGTKRSFLIKKRSDLEQKYEQEVMEIESIRSLKNEVIAQNKNLMLKEMLRDFSEEFETLKKDNEHLQKILHTKTQKIKNKKSKILNTVLSGQDIAELISLKTGIPQDNMLTSEKTRLMQMENILNSKVIGQKNACHAVSNAIRRGRAGISNPNKPIGSFLFLGPSGVGKTELARVLCEFMFENESHMIRFDMSEFMERHTVMRLIGSPPGYQGSKEGGQLTEQVRQKPFSLVLFDEIEKAHPDVLNILLQVLDEGHLTDSKGLKVLFNNTVIIMTSNLAAEIILHANGTSENLREMITGKLLTVLRPEFINRIDEIVNFNVLKKEDLGKIFDLYFNKLKARLAAKNISIAISDEAKNFVISYNKDAKFGARPLRRSFQSLIENSLALFIIEAEEEKHLSFKAELDKEKNELFFRDVLKP